MSKTLNTLQKPSVSPNYAVGSITNLGNENPISDYVSQFTSENYVSQFTSGIYDPFFVGFDRFFDELTKVPSMKNIHYPPYNIRKVDDLSYIIEIAIAGFVKEEIDINLENSLLVVAGTKSSEDSVEYLHKGISTRAFRREYKLADTVEVEEASLKDGILTILLKNNIPEHKLPKKIKIS